MAAWLGLRQEEAEAGAEARSWQYDSTWEEDDDDDEEAKEEEEEEEEKEKEEAGDEDRLEDAEEPARGSGQAQVGPGGFGGGSAGATGGGSEASAPHSPSLHLPSPPAGDFGPFFSLILKFSVSNRSSLNGLQGAEGGLGCGRRSGAEQLFLIAASCWGSKSSAPPKKSSPFGNELCREGL